MLKNLIFSQFKTKRSNIRA